MPNTGHVFIPDPSFAQRHAARIEDEQHPTTVWKRPWLTPPQTTGKVFEVVNTAVVTLKGFKSFTPLQVALLALAEAKRTNCDQIRVKSPHQYGRAGLKATADVVFAVRELLPLAEQTVLAPRVNRNTVNVQQCSMDHPLSGRWQLTENRVFTPVS